MIIYKIEMSCNSSRGKHPNVTRRLQRHHQINMEERWSPRQRRSGESEPLLSPRTDVTNGPEPHLSCKLTIIYAELRSRPEPAAQSFKNASVNRSVDSNQQQRDESLADGAGGPGRVVSNWSYCQEPGLDLCTHANMLTSANAECMPGFLFSALAWPRLSVDSEMVLHIDTSL